MRRDCVVQSSELCSPIGCAQDRNTHTISETFDRHSRLKATIESLTVIVAIWCINAGLPGLFHNFPITLS